MTLLGARTTTLLGAASPLTAHLFAGGARPATVLGVFRTAVYLQVGEHHQVLPVLAADALLLPTGLRVPEPSHRLDWGVRPGDVVELDRQLLRADGLQVRVVRHWRPTPVRPVARPAGAGELRTVAARLSSSASSPRLVHRCAQLVRAARSGEDGEVLRARVRAMVGAGPGLTPSGDDALCAVLLLLRAADQQAVCRAVGDAVSAAWAATTSVSASLLDAALRGYAAPEVSRLVHAALIGAHRATESALAVVLGIGHTSGADLTAGLAGGLHALATDEPMHAWATDEPLHRTAAPTGVTRRKGTL